MCKSFLDVDVQFSVSFITEGQIDSFLLSQGRDCVNHLTRAENYYSEGARKG
jgi:hypothetical protein